MEKKEGDDGFRIPFEVLFVVLMLGIGGWAVSAFFSAPYNTNDFEIVKSEEQQVSYTDFIITGYIGNRSEIPVRPVSLTVDAYNADGRIVGTGTAQLESLPEIPHLAGCKCTVTLPVLGGGETMSRILFIPRSVNGTGKLMTLYLELE